ncbi:DNA-binding transcriptional LysR family regulator [Microbacterium sp. SORGH_AS 1204]|uniref:LysR family transcriptional regulator n=1 Tax=Microbacterium sp. SORGH_AS_1204 TaxID=3041785 RepID=UPI0027923F0C|nr:LysR family transcriptional regulator [Microbacterium sp. SORGH_AS_1204]MDQ1135722.1 DNA-binding transcriptional LysR family regulator [Microbacterium sp. SORGH_AS_1204]
MDLRALECFAAVADEGSFSRAADRLGIAQPSVSQQVGKLERELLTSLFERSSRGVSLTPSGRSLLPSARRALNAVEDLRNAADERAGRLTGGLNLGVVDGLEVTAFPAAMGVVRQRHPLLELRLRDGTSGVLLKKLMDRSLDAVVIAEPPRALPHYLGTRLLLEEDLVVVRPASSCEQSTGPLRLTDVSAELTVSYPSESGIGALIADAARRTGAELHFPYTTNDASLHVALALAGLGAALTVGSAETYEAARGARVLPLDPPIRLRKLLVWISEPRPSRAVRELVAAFDAVA